jgi:hypothetical protein
MIVYYPYCKCIGYNFGTSTYIKYECGTKQSNVDDHVSISPKCLSRAIQQEIEKIKKEKL